MSRSSTQRRTEDCAAAEFAIKAHVLASERQILAEIPEANRTLQEVTGLVNLTEAPEDAVCSLIIDLMEYCEREKIDWTEDVMSRANRYLAS